MKKEKFETHVKKEFLKGESGKTRVSKNRANNKSLEFLEEEVDTSKNFSSLDEDSSSEISSEEDTSKLSSGSLSSTFEPEGGFEFPKETTQTSQSFIVKLPYSGVDSDADHEGVDSGFLEDILEDLVIGETKQATFSDFGGEVLLEVLDRRHDPPERVLVWVKKDDVKKLLSWLRFWAATHA